jgi:ssDNA-binding Zn-finger/Zn-ribbon topoisomerase 1
MEEGKKKMVMVGIIAGCIVAAVVITVVTRSGGEGGLDSLRKGQEMYWIKCRDPKCENTWQMDKKDYFEYVEKNRAGFTVPGIPCPKCGGKTGYLAIKCPKCGYIFEKSPEGGDRCPKCGYSALEEVRKKAKAHGNAPPAAEEK